MFVYVLNYSGKPLMPTSRCRHVRRVLKDNKNPFTIQLTYKTEDVVQRLCVGIDPGRTNIGVAVVKENGRSVMHAQAITRNKEIPELVEDQANYHIDTNGNKHRASYCTTIRQNTGLVFI